jgi:uncharacterized protein (DUF1684 family)
MVEVCHCSRLAIWLRMQIILSSEACGDLMHSKVVALVLISLLPGVLGQAADVDVAYQKNYKKWQSELNDNLKKNWLTLVGLFWLKEGANRVGGDHKLEIPLPEDKAGPQIGVIEFHGNKAVFTAASGAKVTSDGKPVHTIELKSDISGKPTVLQVGDLKMLMIQRGQKYGIRVRDTNSKSVTEFKGTTFYPVNGDYIVKATFVPYDKPKKVAIPTVLGQDAEMDSAGYVEFMLNGQKQHLQALSESPEEFFFIIKDQTAGKGTYPAGRFLYTDPPKDGKVVMDFNRAHNPPCAWTPYATCPLPPKENYMSVGVEAGEKYEGHH